MSEENMTQRELRRSAKAERAAQEQKAQKRSNILYGTIAGIFALFAILAIVWKTGVISTMTPAVTINGQNYNSAELNFHLQNAYLNFVNDNADYLSYMGLDTTQPLKSQVLSDDTATAFELEAGQTWYDVFLQIAIEQMGTIQNTLDDAKANNFVYPESVNTQFDSAMDSLKETAKANGVSVNRYLKTNFNGLTEKAYKSQLLNMIRYSVYTDAYQKALSYTEDELAEAYNADPKSYDLVSYERVSVSGVASSTTDADGNVIPATDEVKAAVKMAAQAKADELLEAYRNGGDLKALAEEDSTCSYYSNDGTSFYGDVVTTWLFDDARKAGDCEVLESGSYYYMVVFHSRTRDNTPTVDVRHILCAIGEATLTEEDEGYIDEQLELAIQARADADALLEQWKSGEATEASFAAMATEHSQDPGSASNGGLYEDVYVGEMVAAFNDWCFDASRQAGDTGVVETPYGAHVMYYVAQGEPHWQVSVRDNLSAAATDEWAATFSGENEVTFHDFGMKFVG